MFFCKDNVLCCSAIRNQVFGVLVFCLSHQYWGGLLEAVQQIFLHQTESFAPGLPAQDALHPHWWTLFGPQSHPVIVRFQPLIAVRTHHCVVVQKTEGFVLLCCWEEERHRLSSTKSGNIVLHRIYHLDNNTCVTTEVEVDVSVRIKNVLMVFFSFIPSCYAKTQPQLPLYSREVVERTMLRI